jgi:hypothetical protein
MFTSLSEANLIGLKIGENFVFLESLKNTQKLGISLNGFAPEMCGAFHQTINFKNLTEFDISNNWIMFGGFVHLKTGLLKANKMTRLRLGTNKLFKLIGNVSLLVDVLQGMPHLEEL